MAQTPPTVCLFCDGPLEPNEPVVFRGKGKLGHIRCWRPDKAERLAIAERPATAQVQQPDSSSAGTP